MVDDATAKEGIKRRLTQISHLMWAASISGMMVVGFLPDWALQDTYLTASRTDSEDNDEN